MWEVFGLKLEVGRFLDFRNFYFGCFKIVLSAFSCPDSFPKWPCVLLVSFPWFRSDSGGFFFFFSKVGEVNARLDECSPLDVRICPPQHGDMYGNNSKSLEKAKKKIKVLTSLKN